MSKTLRMLGALALATASVPFLAVQPAVAETAAETASVGAYYLRENPGTVTLPVAGTQKLPDNAKSADGVAEDDLAVAVAPPAAPTPDKFSALMWDLLALTPGAVVSKAVVTLPLSENSASRQVNNSPDYVVACAVGNQGFADADGEPFTDAPEVKCKDFSAKAKSVNGGKAYEFDITGLAQKWTESNDGVALYPSEAGFKSGFQTVFAPKAQARLTLSFVPAVDTVLPPAPPATVDTGASGGAPLDSGTFIPPTAPQTGTLGSVSAPTVPEPQPQPMAAPQPQQQVALPVAAASAPPMRLDAATWLALGGGALLLLLASLALGAPATVPAERATNRRGGVGEQLARRQRASAGAPTRLRTRIV